MAEFVLMPKAGQTMEEGTIVSWLKKEGEKVEKGEPILVIQTDKADLEVEAPNSGVLKAILVPEGETVPVFSPVGVIAEPGEEVDVEKLKAEKPASAEAEAQETGAEKDQGAASELQIPKATPAAKEVARRAGVDLRAVSGTGIGGRITRRDVEKFLESPERAASPVAKNLARELGVDLSTVKGTGPQGRIIKRDVEAAARASSLQVQAQIEGEAETRQLTGMRKAIAEALQLSKQKSPHFYVTVAVDMTKSVAFRQYLSETGRKVTINDLVLRACVLALLENPKLNCRVEGDKVTYHRSINLGVAVGLEDGLVVPVIVDAQRYNLQELSGQSRHVKEAARRGRLIGTGKGTFTVTNLGMFGVESFSAVINPPEGAILAVGAIKDELVVENGSFSIRKMMRITLSADHRVIDGVLAAKFLNSVKKFLENPETLA